MVELDIMDMKDGKKDLNLEFPTDELSNMQEEFFGNIQLKGIITKIGNRYTFVGNAVCSSKLICDRSLKEFEQIIDSEISMNFLADTNLFMLAGDDKISPNNEIIIHEDTRKIDITDEVLEQLAVALPMKRISPEYEDKEIDEIFPEISDKISKEEKKENDVDDRWSALKNIKFNN